MTDLDLMLDFMVQVIVILGSCSIVGWIGRRFLMQAQVTMEMVTGVMLGPSLLGMLSPKIQQFLFPAFIEAGNPASGRHPSMSILYVIAQIGLVLYMFLIGQEFNVELVASRAKGAIAVSLGGIVFPFLFGAVACLTVLRNHDDLFAHGISLGSQVLYLGAAMSITAFPMLARIIYEAGMANTSLGTLALGAGATDDAVAWSLLAVVLAVAKGNANYALFAIVGGAIFVTLMLTVGRRLLSGLARVVEKEGQVSQSVVTFTLLLLFASAWFTDAIGVYAVFGAFTMGMAMPRGKLTAEMNRTLEKVTVGLFLPFFFVYSGLNTKIGSLNSVELWISALVLLLAAIGGKFGGCYLAARWVGESNREALAIGTLMNSRGLMELIILNIGLQQKVITTQLFTMMTIMAIVTTLMAAPLFEWIYGRQARSAVLAVQN